MKESFEIASKIINLFYNENIEDKELPVIITIYEENEGNHFQDVSLRLQKEFVRV